MGAATQARIPVPAAALAGFCRRHHIRSLAFFGSVLRDDFGPASDIDVLIEFEPGRTPGLSFFSLADELARILGRRVDCTTPGGLSRYLRDKVLAEARTIYAAAG